MAYRQHGIFSYLLDKMVGLIAECYDDDGDVPVLFEDENENDVPAMRVFFAGYNEQKMNNMMNRIQVKKKLEGEDGPEFECLVRPPVLYELNIAVMTEHMDVRGSLENIGRLIGYLREHNQLEVGDYDWAGNNGEDIILTTSPLNTDWLIRAGIRSEGSQQIGVVLHVTAGLESTAVEQFTRVKERQFAARKK